MRMLPPIAATALSVAVSSAMGATLEEVVVTAQKREQNLSDVSISINAFAGDDISALGLIRPADIAAYTPGMYVKPTVGDQNPVITVRGVGFNDFTPIQNPGVGVYVDQVIVPYHPMMSFQLLDLARVEVLKGPQGTLYGRNSTAGAINFVSNKPTQETSGHVDLGYSSWDTIDAEVAVGGGLSEQLSARLAVNYRDRGDSYQKNRANRDDNIGEQERLAYRLSLLWEQEGFDALLNIHGGKDESGQVALEHLASFDATTFAEPCAPVAAGNRAEGACVNAAGYFDPDSDPYEGDYSVSNGGTDNDSLGFGLTMNFELSESLTLTSVTGYDEYERDQLQDIDASPLIFLDNSFQDDTESLSQELRLTSTGDAVKWVAGVFYSDDSVEAIQRVNSAQGIGAGTIVNDQDSESLALFVNAEFDLSEQWTVLAGLRYTDEEKEWRGGSLAPGLGVNNFASDSIDDTDLSGQLGLEFRPNDDHLLYLKASKGFRSGGFPGGFTASPQQLEAFDSETVYAYEAGTKSLMLDGSLQLNAAVYYYDWQDLQTQFTEARDGLISLFLTNAGDADIYGLDLDFSWAVTEQFSLRGGINLMDSEVSSSDPRLDGNELANAPELTYNLIAAYTVPLDSYQLTFSVDTTYTDERYFTSDNLEVFTGDDYALYNARIELLPDSELWQVAVWGRNLSDEEYRTEGFNQFGLFGSSYHAYGEPRSAGISLSYNF